MYKLYTATIDAGTIRRYHLLRANKELMMESLEKKLLPVSLLHWANHKVVRIPSTLRPGKFFVWEVVGIGVDQRSNYIGFLSFSEYSAILKIIGNDQKHVGSSIADLRIVHINYVE